ncbi:hypothetical protein FACS1894147_10670 [Spirochaetia bacterium]|nr:hypothetical protein FACS1894147_10670 [Spirochaetia bacterium]
MLDKVKIYFKIQCPIYLDEKGFSLTENIKIQYYDHKHVDTSLANTDWGERIKCENLLQNKKKIKPLMSSPRQLSWSASFHALEKSYSHFTKARYKIATKKLMCYFGNAFGPISILGKITNIDFNVEEDVMAAFKNDVHHPNEKRATAAIIIGKMGNEYDARIISMSGSAEKNQILNRELIIPYHDFTNYVSQFQYNLNISGLRLSIPNRFIESFMVGTAIVTDKLSVRWYLPFNKEVVETIEMGYCKESQVDWVGFENDIKSLPVIHKDEILSEFNKKWAPEVVAQYIIDSVVNN